MMKPGAVEALPLKVQSKALPLLMSLHTSVPDAPLTVNRATGPDGFTVSVAVLVALKFPVMTADVCELTLLVDTLNVPLVEPAGIWMFAGTVAALELLDSVTNAPPDAAGMSSVAVPCEVPPPVTVLGFNVIDASVGWTSGDTLRVALAVVPPNEPFIGTSAEALTTRVETVNVWLVAPAGTVTLPGTVTGSAAVNETAAPPAGAAPLNVTVPVVEPPPITAVTASVRAVSVTGGPAAVTVSADDWLPLNVAVIVVGPAPTVVTAKTVLEEPAGTVTVAGTVATAVLLLVSDTAAPPAAAAPERITVPETAVPTVTLDELNVTPVTETVTVGGVGGVESPPHRATKSAATTAASMMGSFTGRVLFMAISVRRISGR